MTFQQVKMEVTKTVVKAGKNSRERVGDVLIHVPTVADLITDAKQTVVEGKPVFDDEGLPVYDRDQDNWLQSAIYAQVKAQARNKLVPQTTSLKDGVTIAIDWAGLTADNGGGGAIHLALIREVKALFSTWVATLGKSQGAVAKIVGAFNQPDALKVADATSKEKIAQYVTDFAASLSDADQEKYSKHILKVLDAATSEAVDAEDF